MDEPFFFKTESYTNNFCEEKTEIRQKMDDQYFKTDSYV